MTLLCPLNPACLECWTLRFGSRQEPAEQNWWRKVSIGDKKNVSKLLPIYTKLRGVALLRWHPSGTGTASCTGWVEAKEPLAWGNHHSWFLLSPGTKQTNSSEEGARHSLAFLHSLQKAIFNSCCSYTRAELRVTKATPCPGLDSNTGKGTLALWTLTWLQTQPSSSKVWKLCIKKVLYTCYCPLWKQNDHPGWEAALHPQSNWAGLFALPFLQDIKGHVARCIRQPSKASPPLQIN